MLFTFLQVNSSNKMNRRLLNRSLSLFGGDMNRCLLSAVRLCFVCIVFSVPSLSVMSQEVRTDEVKNDDSDDKALFAQWLLELKNEALAKGIKPEVVSAVVGDIQHLPRVIKKDRQQPEFKESYAQYLKARVSPWRIKKGVSVYESSGAAIHEVSAEFGVPARFVLAILGVETNYGTIKLSYSAFDVLATLSYDGRRSARFRKEIFAAMRMIDEGYASQSQLKSSWAGALGQPQFMPSTYLQFAQDFNGDGKKDIWSQGPDLYASVAKYLHHYGWKKNETWGRKVVLPEGKAAQLAADKTNVVAIDKMCQRYSKHLTGWKSLTQWNELGVRRLNLTSLPSREMSASLIVTDEKYGEGYLVYRNFCALMRYNPSFKYALSVGSLADSFK